MKKFSKKMITTVVVVVLCLVAVVYRYFYYIPVKPDKSPDKIVQDSRRTSELKGKDELIDGKVYVQNNTVIATMVIKDNVSEEKAKELANKYAQKLKDQYKDMEINVQAVQSGKKVADIKIDK